MGHCVSMRFAAAVVTAFMAAGGPSLCDAHSSERSSVTIGGLRTEYSPEPLGIDAARPRLSWQLQSSARNVMQSAYQIRVARDSSRFADRTALVFDSGKTMSSQSVWIPYAGPALQSRQRYCWQVRIWDEKGLATSWSKPACWEMGLLSKSDWQAQWIEPQVPEDPAKSNPSPLLRSDFSVDGKIARARVYVTSLGLYELHLNGARVGDRLFTPGWTSYANRLQYQVYDVMHLLQQGRNAVGAALGDGWYRGRLGQQGLRAYYGDRLALLLQMEITYADGRVQTVTTNKDWKSATGAVLLSDIYDGETYDARLERKGWANAGYDDAGWHGVKAIQSPGAALIATAGPPVRRIEERKPVRLFKTPQGLTVADMGQNMTGWVRLRVRGAAGTKVTLRHGEILDPGGNFYTDNLRRAQQKIEYTLKGEGAEEFEPHFTFQGFRYVAIEGYPGELRNDSVTGIVIHSDMAVTGQFETSDPLVNRLQQNILWSQRGNFLDVPTDCPQRAERFGWTGDAQLFSPTAAFNMDVSGFFAKWLGDLAADQAASGAVPSVVPDINLFPPPTRERRQDPPGWALNMAGWADAATVIPWNQYLAYADSGVLAAQYASMKRWADYQRERAGPDFIWDGDFQLADWLDIVKLEKPIAPGSNSPDDRGSTSPDLVSTAYYAHSVDNVRRAAQALGKTQDAAEYGALFDTISRAFRTRFVAADGRVGEGTQTAYVLALDFDLLPEDSRPLAARYLAEDVSRYGRLTTGLLGTPHLLAVLSRFGHLEAAYQLLNRKEFPSWLYPVTRGATTIWERWDGIKPDGTLADPRRNSFNHYGLGAVGEWMYRVMAGINPDPADPGYRHSIIAPRPGGGLTHVKSALDTIYGRLASEWAIDNKQFTLKITVPPNTRATVHLPRARAVDVGSGIHRFSYPWRDD